MYGLLKGLERQGLEQERAGRRASSSPWQLVRTVFWSFFGVRRMQHLESDAVSITPLQAIGAGVAGAVLLVLSLLALVRFILA